LSGQQKDILQQGEQKSIQTDRVILMSGPQEEVEVIQWIYRAFVEDNLVESKLAKMLNDRRIKTDIGREWTCGTIHQVLTSEKYIGNNIYNRISFKLKKKRIINTPSMWIRGNAKFEPIISADLFARVQEITRERTHKYSDDELLSQLRRLLDRKGHLSGLVLHEE
jgi:hypothetical protein